jgi:ribosomal protein S9
LVEVVDDAGASVSPKVVVAELAGVGRNGQATAAAIQIARGIDESERGERIGLGWVGLTDPDPSRVGLAEPKWAGWAGWPDGPNWLWAN